MSTNANVKAPESGHWYTTDGKPCYEVLKADGKGMTPTTLRHARKMNLLPSVTTILRVLDKPALTAWKIEQAVLAVMTTPRQPEEADDAFIKRVLSVDKEQDKERDAAAQLGTDIHAAIELALTGNPYDVALADFVTPVLTAVAKFGTVHSTERIIVGGGYAGRTDAIASDSSDTETVIDFKSTKKLPKESYTEHRMQLAAYAMGMGFPVKVRTANIYISTVDRGQISVCVNEDVEETFKAFQHLLAVWQWLSDYTPKQ